MLTISQVRGLASRLERAQTIADAGAVQKISGLPNDYVVRNGDGTQYYLVTIEPDCERCTCPDYQQRGKPLGLPCKHILAAQIVDELRQTEKGG